MPKHGSWDRGYSRVKTGPNPCAHEAYILVKESDNKHVK